MSAGSGSYGGLAWGPGTRYPVSKMEGVRDMPPVRARDLELADQHGSATLPDYVGTRTVVLTLGIRGDDHAGLEQLSEDVRQATPPAEAPQQLLVRDGTRLFWAKPRRRALPEDSEALWRLGQAVVQFECTDPREYEAAVRTASTALPTGGSGGMGYPITYPFGFGSGGVGGDLVLTNPGNVPAPLLVRIDGPVTNPTFAIDGRALQLQLVLAAGDFLLIDTEARSVLLNGTASRRGAVVAGSVWPQVPPGTSTLQYRASSASDPAALLSVTYRGAWL